MLLTVGITLLIGALMILVWRLLKRGTSRERNTDLHTPIADLKVDLAKSQFEEKKENVSQLYRRHGRKDNKSEWNAFIEVPAQILSHEEDTKEQTQIPPDLPGKPIKKDVSSDTVEITWQFPRQLDSGEYFQVRYKINDGKSKWKIYNEEFTNTCIELKGLTANTKYIFKVRVVIDDNEGPYSPDSDEIATPKSAAVELAPFCVDMKPGNPTLKKVNLSEIKTARNEKGKTRKFEIGKRVENMLGEKTIMLIGATGTGKSTLADGIVNFVLGVNLEDPFRFSIVNLEPEEDGRKENQAFSQTEWITCYTINPMEGSRLKYKLNIIDTPGFGDTRGLERDREIVFQIRELFDGSGDKGISKLDAVCFLAKAPDARLTATQTYIFHSIMSLFGKDIKDNICTLITFADGQDPPVIAALKESGLPFGDCFTFNNSALFSSNETSRNTNIPFFWHMGLDSYKRFFDHLKNLQTRTLVLTKDVLKQREKLENTVTNLQPQIDIALTTLEEMRKVRDKFEQNEVAIEDNKDFEYEEEVPKTVVTETPIGIHVTNCITCNRTCHKSCAYSDDEDKQKCCAIKPNGYCGQCELAGKTCHWKQHRNTRVIYSIVMEKRKETYKHKLEMYEKATGKLLNCSQLIEEMSKDIERFNDAIRLSMEVVNACNNKLKEIALNANPLTVVEHIDLLINAEKQEKKPGFQARIQSLESCKKGALIDEDVQRVTLAYDENKSKQKNILKSLKRLFNFLKR